MYIPSFSLEIARKGDSDESGGGGRLEALNKGDCGASSLLLILNTNSETQDVSPDR